MNLIASFLKIQDPRRPQGLRTTLPQVLCMIVIANVCGYHGSRAVARFSKLYRDLLTRELGLKHKTPSHYTFSDVLKRVDASELIACFTEWSSQYIDLKEGDPVSGDGKALGSTVQNMHSKGQSFEAVVSIFCQKTGIVQSLQEYRNDKKSEIEIVRLLIGDLHGMGLKIHLDALHTQKNS